jgi:iron complex outermembrane receptor protein
MLRNPIQEVLPEPNSARSNRKAATKIISYKLIFSLSAKLHLETGLAFNTTLFLAGSCGSGDNSRPSLHLWEAVSPRAGLYSFTKTKTIYASISKGFSTPSVAETLTPKDKLHQPKPEIGWNYELGLKRNGLEQ